MRCTPISSQPTRLCSKCAARPRALRVALAAIGPERVVVDVVVAMARDAQVARAAEQPPARVARHARHAIVRARELRRRHVVPGVDDLPVVGDVARRAQRAELPAMHVGLAVAAAALARRRLEVDRLMAVVALDLAVLALERPVADLRDRCGRSSPCPSGEWQVSQCVPSSPRVRVVLLVAVVAGVAACRGCWRSRAARGSPRTTRPCDCRRAATWSWCRDRRAAPPTCRRCGSSGSPCRACPCAARRGGTTARTAAACSP